MASSYIPLRQIFDLTKFTADQQSRVLELLQSGDIRAQSAESAKANLDLYYTENDLTLAIKRLPIAESSRDDAFLQASKQAGTYRIWAHGDYYTIKAIERGFQVFSYRDYRHVFPEQEIHADFWERAWIDEIRWVVLCDDLINLLRREFMKVGLLRDDFQKYFGSALLPRKPRGRPIEHVVQEKAAAAAKRVLSENEDISQTDWAAHVLNAIVGPKPERTTFNELYGAIFTKNRKDRKSEK